MLLPLPCHRHHHPFPPSPHIPHRRFCCSRAKKKGRERSAECLSQTQLPPALIHLLSLLPHPKLSFIGTCPMGGRGIGEHSHTHTWMGLRRRREREDEGSGGACLFARKKKKKVHRRKKATTTFLCSPLISVSGTSLSLHGEKRSNRVQRVRKHKQSILKLMYVALNTFLALRLYNFFVHLWRLLCKQAGEAPPSHPSAPEENGYREEGGGESGGMPHEGGGRGGGFA